MKLLGIHLNNKKSMIEMIESMEELMNQKKSNRTIKYVVNLKFRKNHTKNSHRKDEI